jgi:hypothetical protein
MRRAILGLVLGLTLVSFAPAGLAASESAAKARIDEAMSYDGLERVPVKGVELAYKRPGASLAGYTKVMIDPVEVAFDKNWDPKKVGSAFRVSDAQREDIRSGLATIVRQEFVKALQNKDGYPVVDVPGPDVLRVKIDLINVYVSAPDTMTSGRSAVFTVSAGRATLSLALYDSQSDQIIARVVDRQEARNTGVMTMSNRVQNEAQARDVASAWARILRRGLDRAKAAG